MKNADTKNCFRICQVLPFKRLSSYSYSSREKGPKIEGWQKRTLETPITEREFTPNSNIGILCGEVSGVIVLDIDIKDRGLEIFNELLAQEDVNEDSLTRVATTGSGGKHLFFQYNPAFSRCGTKVVSLNGTKIGWDIKSNTGQVVVEPSLHKDTAEMYEFNEFPRLDQTNA